MSGSPFINKGYIFLSFLLVMFSGLWTAALYTIVGGYRFFKGNFNLKILAIGSFES
jgi:hypothetical protein